MISAPYASRRHAIISPAYRHCIIIFLCRYSFFFFVLRYDFFFDAALIRRLFAIITSAFR